LFFQAEGGIRDGHVTGVQTCALPIFSVEVNEPHFGVFEVETGRRRGTLEGSLIPKATEAERIIPRKRIGRDKKIDPPVAIRVDQIGRASCRERSEISEVVE